MDRTVHPGPSIPLLLLGLTQSSIPNVWVLGVCPPSPQPSIYRYKPIKKHLNIFLHMHLKRKCIKSAYFKFKALSSSADFIVVFRLLNKCIFCILAFCSFRDLKWSAIMEARQGCSCSRWNSTNIEQFNHLRSTTLHRRFFWTNHGIFNSFVVWDVLLTGTFVHKLGYSSNHLG